MKKLYRIMPLLLGGAFLFSGCANTEALEKRVAFIENNMESIIADHEEFRKVTNNHAEILGQMYRWIETAQAKGYKVDQMERDLVQMQEKLSRIEFVRMPNGKYFIRVTDQPKNY